MLNSMQMAWEIVFPVAFMLAVGVACRRTGLVGKQMVQDVNRLIFNLLLPLLNFINIYSTDKDLFFTRENLILMGICATASVGTVIVSSLLLRWRRCPMTVRGALVQGMYQTNGVIFVLPIITALCGADQLAPMSLLILVLSPLHMVLTVLVLAPIRGDKMNLKNTVSEILRNPVLIASVLAFVMLVLEIRLPVLVTNTMQTMANVTTPLSFIVLGASLQLSGFRKNRVRILAVGTVRLLVSPTLCLGAGLLLGLRDTHIATMVLLMGAPTAVSSFTLAQTYGADESLAAEIVTATTLAAAVTTFCWITLLNQLGFC